ncbi:MULTISPECIES: uroporphyrinogen-III synthase [unclassified Legionella]|uniref:uroporphyrinogen-III synthase n=1 Tax=unclassified Legionella TaxID=2622702 RepID=UPI00105699EA|nr:MULTISPECIES: uroporphyrinogen-III synthase [unclassified Legionella]MDI9819564.1 uroporphyrinogen-III synthase [Legionella sp. PL877]
MNYSLQGLRILNTRPSEQGKLLSLAIKAAGGLAVECPALTIEPKDKIWVTSLPNLQQVENAIFISANAVHCCFRVLKEEKIIWPGSIQIIAVGQGTANALHQNHIKVDLMPAVPQSESLLALEAMQNVNKKTILLFKGEGGRTLIADTLIGRGANLIPVDVYKRNPPDLDRQQVQTLWHENAVDIILFTSQQAMANIFILFGKEAQSWLCDKPCLVISERLAKAAAQLGIKTIIVSNPETILITLHQFNQGLVHGQ